MDYTTAFAISASGMQVEKLRLDVIALNLANVDSVATRDGELYQPRRLVAEARRTQSFAVQIGDAMRRISLPTGVDVRDVSPLDLAPRRVYDPSHPMADAEGFVSYPDINPVSEMLQLVEATRAYEANVRTLNAAKTMALRAIEIGNAR